MASAERTLGSSFLSGARSCNLMRGVLQTWRKESPLSLKLEGPGDEWNGQALLISPFIALATPPLS